MRSFILLSIEGNIGGGKSTMLNHMKEKYPEFIYIDEPVDVWQQLKDNEGTSLLQHFYQDTPRWAYTLQNTAFITRYHNAKKAIDSLETLPAQTEPYILITERSVLTDRYVFAQMLKDDGKLSPIEWQVYTYWYEIFANMIPISGLIYITTEHDLCHERIKHRGREGEENIPMAYLESLDAYHQRWIHSSDLPVCHITSDKSNCDKIHEFIDTFKAQKKG